MSSTTPYIYIYNLDSTIKLPTLPKLRYASLPPVRPFEQTGEKTLIQRVLNKIYLKLYSIIEDRKD